MLSTVYSVLKGTERIWLFFLSKECDRWNGIKKDFVKDLYIVYTMYVH